MTEATVPEPRALARELDTVLDENVVVVGSPPPEARDLDLLVRPPAQQLLQRWLEEAGFLNDGWTWVPFGAHVDALDVIPAATLGIDGAAMEEIFEQSRPLADFRHLRAPAPHHVLLLLSRWTAEGDGSVSPKRRARLERLLAEDREAWNAARRRADAWHAARALTALEAAFAAGKRMTRAERATALADFLYAPGRTPARARARAWLHVLRSEQKHGRVVSFSGLDGAGKSSQVVALERSLERLGYDTTVQWTRLEWTTLWENRWLGVLGWPARTALALVSRTRTRTSEAEAPASIAPAQVRERSSLISHVWVTVVAVAHGLAQRREVREQLAPGIVVLCDRYTLDAAAHLRFRYGEQRDFGFQIRLLERLSPRPVVAFLLDVPGATAYARKAEQYSLEDLERQSALYRQECGRLGVRRLDGERPRAQLSAEIAEDVWRALRSRAP
jgi:thymidylate kinase